MKNHERLLFMLALLGVVGWSWAQTLNVPVSTVSSWAYTNYPLYGVAITPTDSVALSAPMSIRPDADGAVTATCVGQGLGGTAVTLNMVAGEFFPCQVIEVQDTGTDAITIHGFY